MSDATLELRNWQTRTTTLVDTVESWAQELGWSTRRLEKTLDDHELGRHQVPSLLLQRDLDRLMLEPIGRSGPGTNGIVDLYRLPAYDDIATFYCDGAEWSVHFAFPEVGPVASVREAQALPLSRDSLERVFREMTRHAA